MDGPFHCLGQFFKTKHPSLPRPVGFVDSRCVRFSSRISLELIIECYSSRSNFVSQSFPVS